MAGAASTLLGRLDAAHDNFSKAVQLAPDNADALFFLALTDYKKGKFGEAITLLRSADKSGVEDSDLHYLLAECLLRVSPDKPGLAIAALNRAIELNKDSISARTLRGGYFWMRGRRSAHWRIWSWQIVSILVREVRLIRWRERIAQ